MKTEAARLAAQGVFIGTSGWRYEGWFRQLYDPARYEYRGKVASTRFEKNCLSEYAEVFKTVCVDAAYYAFPNVVHLEGLAAQVPSDFRFAFKVTDEITLKRFPNLPRFVARAGKPNESFLNPEAFVQHFLAPCKSIRSNVGILIFEFSRFHESDFVRGRDFVMLLDSFLAAIPKGWPYGVELRNKQWLQPEYFDCLVRHNVTHVFNSWTHMPEIGKQIRIPQSWTNPALAAARFLLKPGRSFENAVKNFQPYNRTQEVNEDARRAAAELIIEGQRNQPQRKTYIYVGNRLEGNALSTLDAILTLLGKSL